MDIRFRHCWPVALLLIALTALAEPTIVRVAIQPPLPIVDGVTYGETSPQIYAEWWGFTIAPTNYYSPGISLDVDSRIEVTWTNVSTNKRYAVFSKPMREIDQENIIGVSRWYQNSIWFTPTNGRMSISWTQGLPRFVPEQGPSAQRFYRVLERDL